jgi:hypothetical protein
MQKPHTLGTVFGMRISGIGTLKRAAAHDTQLAISRGAC